MKNKLKFQLLLVLVCLALPLTDLLIRVWNVKSLDDFGLIERYFIVYILFAICLMPLLVSLADKAAMQMAKNELKKRNYDNNSK